MASKESLNGTHAPDEEEPPWPVSDGPREPMQHPCSELTLPAKHHLFGSVPASQAPTSATRDSGGSLVEEMQRCIEDKSLRKNWDK